MTIRAGKTAALYGAFYEDGERITDLDSYQIQCRLLSIEGKELSILDSRVETANDGSLCVILNAEDTQKFKGRILFSFRLLKDKTELSRITKDIDII